MGNAGLWIRKCRPRPRARLVASGCGLFLRGEPVREAVPLHPLFRDEQPCGGHTQLAVLGIACSVTASTNSLEPVGPRTTLTGEWRGSAPPPQQVEVWRF